MEAGAEFQQYQPPRDRPGEEGGLPAEFTRWDQRVVSDGEDGAQESVTFELVAESTTRLPERIATFVLDLSRDDRCEGYVQIGRSTEDLEVEIGSPPPGFAHLGRPALCSLIVPDALRTPGGRLVGGARVLHGAMEPWGDRRLLYVPLLPLAAPARQATLVAEWSAADGVSGLLIGAGVDARPGVLPRDRRRLLLRAERLAVPPTDSGTRTLVGRAPGVLLRSAESWNELALLHRESWERALHLPSALLPLAARVLAQPSVDGAVREAGHLALDTVALEPGGGAGGLFRLPAPLDEAVSSGRADAATRAALLTALLRAADLRAEIVLASTIERPSADDVLWAFLDRVLVALPDLRDSRGEPLFIDPTGGAAEIGSLPPGFVGDGLSWGPHGARFVPLPSSVPSADWSLEAVEGPERSVRVHVVGRLHGAGAGALLRWDGAGQPPGARPDSWLAWLGHPAWAGQRLRVQPSGFGGAVVEADAVLDRGALVKDGRTPLPGLHWPNDGTDETRRWPLDLDPVAMSLDETWTFLTLTGSGAESPAPVESHVGSLRLAWSWQGAVLRRRAELRREGGTVSAAAIPQLRALREAFQTFWTR
jgi:hypothetical protein